MKTVKIADVCQSISYGATASAVWKNDGPRLLRITDITGDGVSWEKVPGCVISRSEHESCRLEDGDIVVARTGGTVGKSFLVASPPDSVCASYLLRMRCHRHLILPGFLHLFLQSTSYWRQLLEAAQGAAQPNVNGTTLGDIQLRLPNLSEQEQITLVLSNRLAVAKKAEAAARQQMKDLDLLPGKIVNKTTEQGSKIRTEEIGNVLEEVSRGIGASWKQQRVLGATRSGLAPARERPGKTAERYKPVDAGTVFYNPMRILIGSIAFVDEDDEPGITSPDYVVLKGKPGVVDSRWFYYWLRSPLGERCIQSLARGAVRERMLFNRLAEGEIELPDYNTQVKASQALAKIKPMRQAIQQQLKELELLPQKLLSQVFDS